MSDFCPEWIFGVSCGVTARDFLSSENSINSISRKFSKGLSERFKEIKESIVIGQKWNNDIRIILFIVLNKNYNLLFYEFLNSIK